MNGTAHGFKPLPKGRLSYGLSREPFSGQDRPEVNAFARSGDEGSGPPSRLSKSDPDPATLPSPARRCSERGCIFPLARAATGKCLYHERQRREPAFFHSQQPSMLLLDQAKFALPNTESVDTRHIDRRRLAAEREAASEEAA